MAERIPGRSIKAVIGGFHLLGVPPFRLGRPSKLEIERLGQDLLAYPAARYFTGHCTGQRAFDLLKGVMAERLAPITTGTVLEL